MMVTSTGVTYPAPLPGGISQLVFGENGVAFATDGATLSSFNLSSGQVNWNYSAPSSTSLSIVTSTEGNGLVARLKDTTESITRLDSSGNATLDTWTAATPSNIGASSLSNTTFLASDGFIATPSGTNQVLMLQSDAVIDYPDGVGEASPPEDGREKSIHLPISAFEINDPSVVPSESITVQLNRAQKLWSNKIEGLKFDWDGTITNVLGCTAAGGCSNHDSGPDRLSTAAGLWRECRLERLDHTFPERPWS
jgi:hypothetical protein